MTLPTTTPHTTFQNLYRWRPLNILIHHLINPIRPPKDTITMRQARMLATFHLFQFFFVLIAGPLVYNAAQLQNRFRITVAIVLMLLFLVITYLLCRLLYIRLVGIITPIASTMFWASTALAFSDSLLYPYLLGYMLVPVLLGSMFLPQRWALINALIIGVSQSVIAIVQGANVVVAVAGPVTFHWFLSGLVLLSHNHQRQLQRERQALLAEREREMTFYFEQAHDWIFMLNAEGIITYVNRRMCVDSGYEAADLIGKPPSAFLSNQGIAAIAGPLQTILNGNPVDHLEVEVPLRNGRVIWLDVKGLIRVRDENVIGTFHIARDITPLKQAEAELRRRHDDISRLYQQSQQELLDRQRAEEAERRQRSFAESLVETVAALHSTHHLPDVLHRLATAVAHDMAPDAIAIMLVDNDIATVAYAYGEYQKHTISYYKDIKLSVKDTPNLHKMATIHQPHLIPDTREDSNWVFIPEATWIRCFVGAPIIADNKTIGFLNLESNRPNVYTAADAQKLMVYAQQVAAAIKNAQMVSELGRYNQQLTQLVQERTAELARSNQQMAAILHNSADATALLDTDGRLVRSNPAFTHLFRQQPQAGTHLLDLFTNAAFTRPIATALNDTLTLGQLSRLEILFTPPDTSPIDLDIVLAPIIEEQRISGAVCNLRDISKLKEVARIKDEFIANISHELRTPLANIQLHHDLIARNPARQEVYLSRINRELKRLIYIVESLLRLSRLDSGRILPQFEPADITGLVREYVQDRQEIAALKGLTLRCKEGCDPLVEHPEVPIDRGLIGQVVSILLTNATNYTPAGGLIEVDWALREINGRLHSGIHVIDNGPGIPPAEQPFIFGRFYRGSNAQKTGVPGTGLGLAIAKEIVDIHDGIIEVYSSGVDGEGARFSFWLPHTSPNHNKA